MVHNILKNTLIEEQKCFSVWGTDMMALITTLVEYFNLIGKKVALIPATPFNLVLNLDVEIVEFKSLSNFSNSKTSHLKSTIFINKQMDKSVSVLSIKEIQKISCNNLDGFDNIIFINDLTIPLNTYSSKVIKENRSCLPQIGYLILNANILAGSIIKDNKVLLNVKIDNKKDLALDFAKSLTEPHEIKINIILLDVDSFFKENEVTSISKELLNLGIHSVYYYFDDRFYFLKERT